MPSVNAAWAWRVMVGSSWEARPGTIEFAGEIVHHRAHPLLGHGQRVGDSESRACVSQTDPQATQLQMALAA